MTRLQGILFLLALCVVGFCFIRYQIGQTLKRIIRAGEFGDHLTTYTASHGNDTEAHTWLLMHSVSMQNEMGEHGLVGYKKAFENIYRPNWPVIMNAVEEMNQWKNMETAWSGGPPRQFYDLATMMRGCLLRYVGTLQEEHVESLGNLKNPFIWFQYGVRLMVMLPVLILGWLGIGHGTSISMLATKGIIKFIGSIATTATLIASLVTIFSDWDKAIGNAQKLWSMFRH